jgi:hypothetical protein
MKESIYNKMTNAERKVADVLKEMGIEWRYEKPVFVWDDKNRSRVWTPDFYLISFGVYVEVCGSNEFNYEYSRKIFDVNGHLVIFLHLYKECYKWKDHFIFYLELFTKYRYNNLGKFIENIEL